MTVPWRSLLALAGIILIGLYYTLAAPGGADTHGIVGVTLTEGEALLFGVGLVSVGAVMAGLVLAVHAIARIAEALEALAKIMEGELR